MAKSITAELNRYLKSLERAELEEEVKKLYSKFSDVKKYYELELGQDTAKVLKEYKERLRKEYAPTRGIGKARSSESKKIIDEFKKISVFKKDVIELMLYRVELMLNFTLDYGDMNEAYYDTLESTFLKACELINSEMLVKEFEPKCAQLVNMTRQLGWGVGDAFRSIYDNLVRE